MRKFLAAASVAALSLGVTGVALAQDPPVTSIDNSNQNNTTESNNDNRCRDASIISEAIQTVTQANTQTVVPPSTGDVNASQDNSGMTVDQAVNLLIDCSVTNNTTNNFPPGQTTTVVLPSGQTVVVPVAVPVASAPATSVVGVPRFTG